MVTIKGLTSICHHTIDPLYPFCSPPNPFPSCNHQYVVCIYHLFCSFVHFLYLASYHNGGSGRCSSITKRFIKMLFLALKNSLHPKIQKCIATLQMTISKFKKKNKIFSLPAMEDLLDVALRETGVI